MRRLSLVSLALCAVVTSARADWTAGGLALGDLVISRVGSTFAAVPDHAGGVIAYTTPWDVATRVSTAGEPLWSAAPYAQTNLPPATSIADDGVGGVWIGWAKDADVYVRRWDANGAPAGPTITVCHNLEGVRHVRALASDGAGGVFVLWTDTQTAASPLERLLVSRVNGAGAVIGPANGIPVFSGDASDVLEAQASDGIGGLVVMEREADGVRLQRVTPLVALAWTSTPAIAGTMSSFSIATAGGGDVFASWCDGPSVAGNVRVQRLDANGAPAPGWPAAGAVVSSSRRNPQMSRVCPDGTGGAAVAWVDDRDAGGFYTGDVRVSRVSANAQLVPGWPADGLDPGDCRIPYFDPSAIVPDGSGGFYVGWGDAEYFEHDVHVQHLTGDGAVHPGWPSAGVPVSVERFPAVRVTAPVMVADGLGGAYALWNEWRPCAAHESCNQVRLARMQAGGVLGTPPAGAPRLALAAPSPNPTRGRFTLIATLPDDAPARIEVFDLAGRAEFTRDLRGAGTHAVVVDGAGLAPGVHWVRLAHATGVRASRLVMLR